MKKRCMSMLLAGTLLAATMAGNVVTSFADETSSDDQVTIKLATSLYVEANHQAVFDKLLEKFNEEHPNINVEIYGTGWDGFWQGITTEIASGSEGDILQITPSELNSYYALRDGGAFLSLDDYISNSDVVTADDLVGQEECQIDGKNVALANYAYGSSAIFYRKSILEECGIDPASIVTQEDLTNAMRTVTEKGYVGMGIVVGTHTITGLYFEDEKGPYSADTINVNSQAAIDMASWWQSLISEGLVKAGTDKSDARELFWNGQAAFDRDGPWFIGMTQAESQDVFDDMGVIAMPAVSYNGETYKASPINYPYIMTISSNCEHPDEAWTFIEWMASEEAQEIIAECGMVPCSKAYSGTDTYLAAYPMQAQMMGFEKDYVLTPNPTTPAFSELEQELNEGCQRMFGENLEDPKTVLDEVADQMKSTMADWE